MGDRAIFVRGNWAEGVSGLFDLIVSNPPYIMQGDLAGLSREVREHDPVLALDGGADGLDAFRALSPAVPMLLAPDGLLVLEIGAGQGEQVTRVATLNGLAPCGRRTDLGGIERALSFKRPAVL